MLTPISLHRKITRSLSFPLTALSIMFATQTLAYEIEPSASISDSSASLLGVNHIGLSVRDLDASLAFYQRATGFEVIRREIVHSSSAALLCLFHTTYFI